MEGWVRTKKGNKNVISSPSMMVPLFIPIQVCCRCYCFEMKPVETGDDRVMCFRDRSVGESPGQGQPVEIHAKQIELFGTADPETYPFAEKKAIP